MDDLTQRRIQSLVSSGVPPEDAAYIVRVMEGLNRDWRIYIEVKPGDTGG